MIRGRRPWIDRGEILTGERLQSLTDISLVPLHVRQFHRHVDRYVRELVLFEHPTSLDDATLERLSAKRSLFVYTHELRPFIEHIWPRLTGSGYVLMTHNSDFEVDASYLPWVDGAGDKLACWLAQNVLVGHPKIVPLPIGIANGMWPHGNLRSLHRAMGRAVATPKRELAYLQFNAQTHPARQPAWNALRQNFPQLGATPPPPKTFRGYLADLARHRFAVAPRGNGADTHRFWECLYLGVVPITGRSWHTEHWERQGLPVVLVDDWAQVTAEFLEGQQRPLASREPLLLSTYAAAVEAACIEPAR